MTNLSKLFTMAIALLTVGLCLISCNEQGVQLENQKVQFTLSPFVTDSDIQLPEHTTAKITVASSSGSIILSDYQVAIHSSNGVYVTDFVELVPGTYSITDFVIIEDSVELYVAPKKGAELTTSADALPFSFSVEEARAAVVRVPVADVRNQDVRKFGYTSEKSKANSIAVSVHKVSSNALTSAKAELRQNKKLLDIFSLSASVNSISLGGDPKQPYTLTVYTADAASTKTFSLKELKKEAGKTALHVQLQPALVLSIESYVDAGNEYEEYFDFHMDGTGAVNINWGDGEQSAATLPFEISHEYFTGNYTAIVTGNINHVSDFAGFSYSTIITAITGLTNLTSLKVYDPSWGAVPIKVDLSKCKKLETINVAKYGAPYEPCDLRKEFKLPPQHRINSFIFDAPSFDINREFISAAELEVMVNNVYNNTVHRAIYNGKFFVNPVVTPSPGTQQKLDILTSKYNWQVGFNDDIYNAYDSESARSKTVTDSDAKREQWIRERFTNSEQIIKRAPAAAVLN